MIPPRARVFSPCMAGGLGPKPLDPGPLLLLLPGVSEPALQTTIPGSS